MGLVPSLSLLQPDPDLLAGMGHQTVHPLYHLVLYNGHLELLQHCNHGNRGLGIGKSLAWAHPLPGKAEWYKGQMGSAGNVLLAESVRVKPGKDKNTSEPNASFCFINLLLYS